MTTLQSICVNKIDHKRDTGYVLWCTIPHVCIPICIDVYTKTYTYRYLHYTVLHKFCTVSCSRVYAVQCAHAAIPASAAPPPPPTLRSILGAAAAPSQQLFKPTADARSFKQQLHHGLFKSWLEFIFKRGIGFNGDCWPRRRLDEDHA